MVRRVNNTLLATGLILTPVLSYSLTKTNKINSNSLDQISNAQTKESYTNLQNVAASSVDVNASDLFEDTTLTGHVSGSATEISNTLYSLSLISGSNTQIDATGKNLTMVSQFTSGDGITYEITYIGNSTFSGLANQDITCNKLTLPETLTDISSMAFVADTGLGSLDLSNCIKLTRMNPQTFFSCTNLSSVELPKNVTSIQTNAFACCSSLTSISFPKSLTTINSTAFYSCTNLTSTNLAECAFLTTIGVSAFASCTELSTLDLINCTSLSSIGETAFQGDNKLVTISLPSNLADIGNNAFDQCTAVTTIDLTGMNSTTIPTWSSSIFSSFVSNAEWLIPSTVDTTQLGAWYSNIETWTGITSPNVNINHKASDWAVGVTSGNFQLKINDNSGSSITLVDGKDVAATNLNISNTKIDSVADGAFQNDSNLTGSLTLPTSITSIGANAFKNCTEITQTDLSTYTNLTSIGTGAFQNDTELSGILVLPNSLTSIGANAFTACNKIDGIDLTSYTSIPTNFQTGCFAGLTTNFFIPANTDKTTLTQWYEKINDWTNQTSSDVYSYDNASYWSTGITSGTFELKTGSLNDSSSLTITGSNNLAGNDWELSNQIDAIGEDAFFGATNLTGSLTLPNSITSIGENAFRGCNGLTSIDLTNYTSIPTNLQNDCFGGLTTNFILPASINRATLSNWYYHIKEWTGNETPNVYMQDTATNWASGVTSGNFDLQIGNQEGSLIITINDGKVVQADDLSINNSVNALSEEAFLNNTKLTGLVNIPSSITTIGANAFNGCNNLNEICLNWTDLSLTNNLNINSNWLGTLNNENTTILVPAGMMAAYQDKAQVLGISNCVITDGSTPSGGDTSSLGLTLGLGIGLGVSLIGVTVGWIIYAAKMNKSKKPIK